MTINCPRGVIAALLWGALFLALPACAQTPVLRAELPNTVLVADGSTLYTLNVTLDTRPTPAIGWADWLWQVSAPSYITMVDAQLPASNDFFAGYAMDPFVNYVHPTGDNDRAVADWFEGPSNRHGALATYHFTVSPDAPEGVGSFTLTDVVGVGLDFRSYRPPAVSIESASFSVTTVHTPEPGALAMLGGLSAMALMRRRRSVTKTNR